MTEEIRKEIRNRVKRHQSQMMNATASLGVKLKVLRDGATKKGMTEHEFNTLAAQEMDAVEAYKSPIIEQITGSDEVSQ